MKKFQLQNFQKKNVDRFFLAFEEYHFNHNFSFFVKGQMNQRLIFEI